MPAPEIVEAIVLAFAVFNTEPELITTFPPFMPDAIRLAVPLAPLPLPSPSVMVEPDKSIFPPVVPRFVVPPAAVIIVSVIVLPRLRVPPDCVAVEFSILLIVAVPFVCSKTEPSVRLAIVVSPPETSTFEASIFPVISVVPLPLLEIVELFVISPLIVDLPPLVLTFEPVTFPVIEVAPAVVVTFERFKTLPEIVV